MKIDKRKEKKCCFSRFEFASFSLRRSSDELNFLFVFAVFTNFIKMTRWVTRRLIASTKQWNELIKLNGVQLIAWLNPFIFAIQFLADQFCVVRGASFDGWNKNTKLIKINGIELITFDQHRRSQVETHDKFLNNIKRRNLLIVRNPTESLKRRRIFAKRWKGRSFSVTKSARMSNVAISNRKRWRRDHWFKSLFIGINRFQFEQRSESLKMAKKETEKLQWLRWRGRFSVACDYDRNSDVMSLRDAVWSQRRAKRREKIVTISLEIYFTMIFKTFDDWKRISVREKQKTMNNVSVAFYSIFHRRWNNKMKTKRQTRNRLQFMFLTKTKPRNVYKQMSSFAMAFCYRETIITLFILIVGTKYRGKRLSTSSFTFALERIGKCLLVSTTIECDFVHQSCPIESTFSRLFSIRWRRWRRRRREWRKLLFKLRFIKANQSSTYLMSTSTNSRTFVRSWKRILLTPTPATLTQTWNIWQCVSVSA